MSDVKTVADLKPGDVAYIDGQPFTVKSVDTSDGKTTLVFENVPATKERCEALKRLARDTGGIAAMVPVQLTQFAPDAYFLNRAESMGDTEKATSPMAWWACLPECQRQEDDADAALYENDDKEVE